MTKAIAVFVTCVAALMTAVAAWDRGGTLIDKGLLVAMSVVIVIAVHLLPSISRRPVVWVVWFGCLLCAVYGHLTFLTHASHRSVDSSTQNSAQMIGLDRQFDLTKEALSNIKARPLAEVAAELAVTNDRRMRAALTVEIAEGKKAEKLRDELRRLSSVSTEVVSETGDPVTGMLAEILGVSTGIVSVAVGLTFSILVELIGALLWVEALRPSCLEIDRITAVTLPVTQTKVAGATPVVTPITSRSNSSENNYVTSSKTMNAVKEGNVTDAVEGNKGTSQIERLKLAIAAGTARATVAGIREFLGCGQSRAMEVRRELSI